MGQSRGHTGHWPLARHVALLGGCLALANCSNGHYAGKIDPRYGVASSQRVVEPGQPVPKGGGVYRVGKPYMVSGRTYVPRENVSYNEVGLASWYGDDFHGRYTANGEIFDENALSAAHPTLPLPSYARVTNLRNHKSIVVRVNDRGPYAFNRLIDVSVKTAKVLGFYGQGVAPVKSRVYRPRAAGRLRRQKADGDPARADTGPAGAGPGRCRQGRCTGLFRSAAVAPSGDGAQAASSG